MDDWINIVRGMQETSDGPTAVFFAGTLEPSCLNLFGAVIVILMLVPNIIYAIKYRERKNLCENITAPWSRTPAPSCGQSAGQTSNRRIPKAGCTTTRDGTTPNPCPCSHR